MKLRKPRTPQEKADRVWEGIRYGMVIILLLGILGQCCFKDERRIIKARPPTIDQKLALMDEVYTAAVERNYRELAGGK